MERIWTNQLYVLWVKKIQSRIKNGSRLLFFKEMMSCSKGNEEAIIKDVNLKHKEAIDGIQMNEIWEREREK